MNRLDLTGRVAIVTGAARGIGLAIARRIIESGGSVAVWDMDGAAAQDSARALGRASAHVLDLTDEDAIARAHAETLAAHGKVDVLVNNAGITGGNAPSWALPVAEWRRVVEVNLIAPYLVTRAVVPGMIAGGYGRIVNIASIAGKEGNPNASHYSASKAGLIGFTKSLGKELARTGVLANCITPAAAETDLFRQMTSEQIAWMRSKIPMDRFVTVEEIAAMACWLASEECSFSTGAVFDISGGRAVY
ncbi:SDR family oxidoreductase [Roseomonas alkaliterrae]|uniref:3-oxoacyl-[acyl-carrier protein] reductase n=1 Tax=Neoroseomonas alkaliterrae TaxID=1452450 RepID=A0A840XRH0_9PROT|nr:SDR family NAD(P)-dependent oxidoreductase [Neoroseomonas alkaliterrae]MBB5691155.1 3-oxoacyl-[acyl-carrier protein] reductase [Neoroseomonas alkaliterrae]MBR0675493.1 SDR family oxidoreductase [Neoroseomonas alkaliterrae]